MSRTDDPTPEAEWWWLAVNGPSCAASMVPLPSTVTISPTPEQLLGFRTQGEQLAAQRLLIFAPVSEVERFMAKSVPAKIKSGEVCYIRPDRPQPPTHGPTLWLVGGTDDQARV